MIIVSDLVYMFYVEYSVRNWKLLGDSLNLLIRDYCDPFLSLPILYHDVVLYNLTWFVLQRELIGDNRQE